mmetsp:Transcript_43994/g.94773  ORF Transcript_43994/g.94773 Transcript_43994/m.94773 type:complete len:183 (+) Transcript_43994:2134-2682(+)
MPAPAEEAAADGEALAAVAAAAEAEVEALLEVWRSEAAKLLRPPGGVGGSSSMICTVWTGAPDFAAVATGALRGFGAGSGGGPAGAAADDRGIPGSRRGRTGLAMSSPRALGRFTVVEVEAAAAAGAGALGRWLLALLESLSEPLSDSSSTAAPLLSTAAAAAERADLLFLSVEPESFEGSL